MDQNLHIFKCIRWPNHDRNGLDFVWVPEYLYDITANKLDVPSDWIYPNRYCILADDEIYDKIDPLPIKLNETNGALRSNVSNFKTSTKTMGITECVKEAGKDFTTHHSDVATSGKYLEWMNHFVNCDKKTFNDISKNVKFTLPFVFENLFKTCSSPAIAGIACQHYCRDRFHKRSLPIEVVTCFNEFLKAFRLPNNVLRYDLTPFKKWLLRQPCFKGKSVSSCLRFVLFLCCCLKRSNRRNHEVFFIIQMLNECLEGEIKREYCPGHYILTHPGLNTGVVNEKFLLGYIDDDYLCEDFKKIEVVGRLLRSGFSIISKSIELYEELEVGYGIRIVSESAAKRLLIKNLSRTPNVDSSLLTRYLQDKREFLKSKCRAYFQDTDVEFMRRSQHKELIDYLNKVGFQANKFDKDEIWRGPTFILKEDFDVEDGLMLFYNMLREKTLHFITKLERSKRKHGVQEASGYHQPHYTSSTSKAP